MNVRDCVVESWEATWGREGIWCPRCRRCTPLAVLSVDDAAHASLECESCSETLIIPTPWFKDAPPFRAPSLLGS